MNVCIFVGESCDERYFFPSLLENKLGFLPIEEKDPFIYNKNQIFWIFPFPPKRTKPEGGNFNGYWNNIESVDRLPI